MIEKTPLIAADETVYRYANQWNLVETLQRRGLGPAAIDEVFELFDPDSKDIDANELLDAPFRTKLQLETKFPQGTRFSDGGWHVFYSAIERKSAEAEVFHHYAKAALGDPTKGRTAYYARFSCQFLGDARDLRPKLTEWPELVHSSDYSFCQNLGREADAMTLDGFLAPSARREGGTTVPVFKRRALSDPNVLGLTAFSIDPVTGYLTVRDV